MAATREQVIKEVEALVKEGVDLLVAELRIANSEVASPERTGRKHTAVGENSDHAPSDPSGPQATAAPEGLPLEAAYQSWYTRALPVVKLVLPDRYAEFVEQYKLEKRKEIDFVTYTISDYLIGLRVTRGLGGEEVVNALGAFTSKFQHQIYILRSCSDRLLSSLSDIRGTLQAELLDDELDAASELLKKGHLRAGGALAGVSLERHLAVVAATHGLKTAKANPTIADFNDALKQAGVLDVPNWRFVQRLGDLRNLAAHPKDREPTTEEMQELVAGVRKAIKTMY